MDKIQQNLLFEIANLHGVPEGAYNIRSNGEAAGRASTANIVITTKTDKPGIDINIADGTKNESVHIPVIISQSGIKEMVYNDFYIGEDCDVVIVAGCGIHNDGADDSKHDGIHRFFVGKNSKVRYIEKHYGEGDGNGKRVFNPKTEVHCSEGTTVELEMTQIKGVDSTVRVTEITLDTDATCNVTERLMTHGSQTAQTEITVDLNGDGSHTNVVSRSVARDDSRQTFIAKIRGNAACSGHSECDAIIMDNAIVSAIPEVDANCVDAALIHEAAIGKIAGDQLIKLMTLGLSEKEAEEQIVSGFLK